MFKLNYNIHIEGLFSIKVSYVYLKSETRDKLITYL